MSSAKLSLESWASNYNNTGKNHYKDTSSLETEGLRFSLHNQIVAANPYLCLLTNIVGAIKFQNLKSCNTGCLQEKSKRQCF